MEYGERRLVSISRQDWSFEHKAPRDARRHDEKVKEAIKGNLDAVVSDGSIITADPRSKKKVKVPMHSLELPRFRFGNQNGGIGTGDGNGGQPMPGDEVGEGESEPGDQPGEEYYESELTLDEIQKMVFEDLELPNIKERDNPKLENERDVFNDVRRKRTPTNLDLGRTVMQNILRNAQETGKARVHRISPDDFRVRTWEEERQPESNAVVIAMADISASMGEFEKYVTRAFCWWTVSFLRTKYPKVDIAFIAHDTEAYEVPEEQFFTRGAGGGTKCSSANQKALDIMEQRYPASSYNVFPLHFSDGDNINADNPTCVGLVNEMLDQDVSQYAYIQIGKSSRSALFDAYDKNIDNNRFKNLIIKNKEDVLDALKQVFSAEGDI